MSTTKLVNGSLEHKWYHCALFPPTVTKNLGNKPVGYGSRSSLTMQNALKELGEKTKDEHEDSDWI